MEPLKIVFKNAVFEGDAMSGIANDGTIPTGHLLK